MKNVFFAIILFISSALNAQETQSNKGSIGISFSSLGENDIVYFEDLVGTASYTGENFHAIGINYLYPLKNWLDIETGLEFSKHKFSVSPAPTGDNDIVARTEKLSLINIPVTARINFLRYFFIHAGINFDIDGNISNSIDNQSGIGANSGLGIKYDFNFGGSLFINPYLKSYSLLPFSPDNYHQRVIETGVRFGVMYKIGKRVSKKYIYSSQSSQNLRTLKTAKI